MPIFDATSLLDDGSVVYWKSKAKLTGAGTEILLEEDGNIIVADVMISCIAEPSPATVLTV